MRCTLARTSAFFAIISVVGCSTPQSADRATVDRGLFNRSGFHLKAESDPVDYGPLSDPNGLDESVAIDLALANNAAFQEQLAELGLSRADVIQAGLIANPEFVMLFPIGPKQFEATATLPIEFLWLRERRIEAAQIASERTASRLAQAGVDLIRDVRLAYADLALARRTRELFEESAALREQMATIAHARVKAGEARALDAATAKIDAIRAQQEAKSLVFNTTIAEERLRALMGASAIRTPIVTRNSMDALNQDWNADALVESALGDRSDIQAAQVAIDVAQERERLAWIDWFNMSIVGDVNQKGSKGWETGPGIRFSLPIFNQNQGMIARAAAEVQRLSLQKRTLQDQVNLEVRESYARFAQARDDLNVWRAQILPALDEAVALSRKAYTGGETSLVQVIDMNRQLLEAHIREAKAASDLRRARAELERAVGRRLESKPLTPAAAPTEKAR